MADATRRSPSRAAYPAGSHQPRQRQQLATSSTPAAAAACAAVAATAASSSAAPAGGGAGSRSGPPATGPVVRGGTSSDAAHDVRGEGGGRQTMVVDDSAPRYGDGGGATRQSSGVGGGVHGAMAASAAGGVASAPAGEAPPSGDAPSDRSPDKMANLEVTLRGLEFPNLGDANGDATWDNAVEMVKAAVGDGFELRRLNKTRAAAAATRPNRWNYVVLECEKGGLPKQNDRVADVSARRKTSSKKVGCKFKVGLWWPMEGAAPKLAQGVYLMHHTPDSGGREHERPRSLENNHELSREEVEGQAELISRLHFAGVKTTEIHKAVQDKAVQGVCKRLGLAGAQRVRSIRRKLDQQKDAGGKGQGGGSGELGQQAGAEAGDGDRVGVARRPRILLCLSGSVAAVKAPQLAVLLWEFAEVKILVTEASKHFLDRSKVYNSEAYANFTALDPAISVLGDADEWGAWDAVGDPVLHIQLRDWADMLLVAPLSANTLAKLANGLCDNLVTCVARAWDFRNKKSFLVAPAMNTHMWEHPMTARHLHALKEMGVVVVPPASKRLACGDTGVGALADVEEIQEVARRFVDKAPQR